jgi:hypothetical protein
MITKFKILFEKSVLPETVKNTLFHDYEEKSNELEKLNEKILKLINEWSIINKFYGCNISSFEITRNYNVPLCLKSFFQTGDCLDKNEFEDLLKFMEDPEAYKNIKKYNV